MFEPEDKPIGDASLKALTDKSNELEEVLFKVGEIEQQLGAFAWLDENGFSDIIKNTVSVSFGREEDDSAKKLLETLDTDGYKTAQKKHVEPMTLKAFVREQVEKGSDLPLETFNVYIGQKTKVIKK